MSTATEQTTYWEFHGPGRPPVLHTVTWQRMPWGRQEIRHESRVAR